MELDSSIDNLNSAANTPIDTCANKLQTLPICEVQKLEIPFALAKKHRFQTKICNLHATKSPEKNDKCLH